MEFDFKDTAVYGRYSDGINALVQDLSIGGKLERLAIFQTSVFNDSRRALTGSKHFVFSYKPTLILLAETCISWMIRGRRQ